MIEDVFCSLSGDLFSPKELIEKTGLALENSLEKGENQTWGQRLPSEYGFANLVAPKKENLPEDVYPIDWIASTLALYHSTMLECKVEEFDLTLVITFDTALHYWISVENMKIFSDLGITLCLSAYHKEGIEETTSSLESLEN